MIEGGPGELFPDGADRGANPSLRQDLAPEGRLDFLAATLTAVVCTLVLVGRGKLRSMSGRR